MSFDNSAEQRGAAHAELMRYLSELVGHKRAEPSDDLFSELAAGGELDHDELTGVATLLLTAGHETTANMLGLGTFLLLCRPEQAELVVDLTSNAIMTVDTVVLLVIAVRRVSR
ncbi:hypothetical protein [Sphaerisporangium fuscum]|uniref:hypothetical protein n=1 Tax=Sphaerisporangium fuscum TaxID=2835868 RepID=UPI001BDD9D7D|nr:hypothetical protein [Sphaerisporangium fuscum]